jgi:hypothetical protein
VFSEDAIYGAAKDKILNDLSGGVGREFSIEAFKRESILLRSSKTRARSARLDGNCRKRFNEAARAR